MTTRLNPELAEEFRSVPGMNAEACLNCGVCTAVCPMGYGALPRKLFRYAELGMEQKLEENVDTVYSCLLCRMCEAHCPAGVHIADNVRRLRTVLNRKNHHLS